MTKKQKWDTFRCVRGTFKRNWTWTIADDVKALYFLVKYRDCDVYGICNFNFISKDGVSFWVFPRGYKEFPVWKPCDFTVRKGVK